MPVRGHLYRFTDLVHVAAQVQLPALVQAELAGHLCLVGPALTDPRADLVVVGGEEWPTPGRRTPPRRTSWATRGRACGTSTGTGSSSSGSGSGFGSGGGGGIGSHAGRAVGLPARSRSSSSTSRCTAPSSVTGTAPATHRATSGASAATWAAFRYAEAAVATMISDQA